MNDRAPGDLLPPPREHHRQVRSAMVSVVRSRTISMSPIEQIGRLQSILMDSNLTFQQVYLFFGYLF